MGYLIVSSEDGIAIIDPHSGSWAERTVGWPRTLSTSTSPALTNNDVLAVGAGFASQPDFDPRTGGPMPTFIIGYGTGADVVSILKTDGNVFDKTGTVDAKAVGIMNGFEYHEDNNGDRIYRSKTDIDTITADDWSILGWAEKAQPDQYLGSSAGTSFTPALSASADSDGLSFHLNSSTANANPINAANCMINRTYNTGYFTRDIRGVWLANSKTVDRSYKGNTLTENGTVTEGAVASGAELMGYSGFSSSNYLSRAYDADFQFGTAAFSIMLWFKCTSTSARNIFFARDNGTYNTSNPSITFEVESHKLRWTGQGATTSWDTISPENVDDGEWHFGVINSENGAQELFVDGVSVATTTTSMGSLSNGSALTYIGERPAISSPAAQMTLALFRISTFQPTASEVRKIYEAEKPMFVASAECLLQSGSTDAVLDVDVDPLSGKTLVTQTDAITIFDGLVVDSKPTVNSGNSEKGKLWGALRAEQNSANAYVTAPAVDQRQVNEMVRGLASDLPKGVDLSKAKGWLSYDQSNNLIMGSYNVKSVNDVSAGYFKITWAIPFKSEGSSNYQITALNRNAAFYGGGPWTIEHKIAPFITYSPGTTTGSDSDDVFVLAFGELENE